MDLDTFLDLATSQIHNFCLRSDFEWLTYVQLDAANEEMMRIGLMNSSVRPTLLFGNYQETLHPNQCRDKSTVRAKLRWLVNQGHGRL